MTSSEPSSRVAKRRLDYIISVDRAVCNRGRLVAYTPGNRIVFDSPVTVLPGETLDLDYMNNQINIRMNPHECDD